MSRRVKLLEMCLKKSNEATSVIVLVKVNKVMNTVGSGGNVKEEMDRSEVLQSILGDFFPACIGLLPHSISE